MWYPVVVLVMLSYLCDFSRVITLFMMVSTSSLLNSDVAPGPPFSCYHARHDSTHILHFSLFSNLITPFRKGVKPPR
ncbi:hypothetical protein GE09DRAFT_1113747 [Coniochaeta sp. 2T2.1]|nr:hypothetical protein GE09DRAFT_1113747 [Coniochaeta sp. 2T2.1]